MIVFAPSYDTTTSISVDSIYRLHTYNVSLQSSTLKHTLLDVSAAETFKWQGFGIFTNALTVIVPQKNIVVLKSHVGYGAYNITKYMDGQKGIMTTPAYTGGLASTDISHFYNIKNTYNITVNIKVLDFLGSPFVVFQSQNDDKWINSK
uniref:IgGFc-binding protein N-terminal domain-containing protein n=1 Tax=Panagrolaimus davidi TaxID=227884 RepID=A0A914QDA2_9BILA